MKNLATTALLAAALLAAPAAFAQPGGFLSVQVSRVNLDNPGGTVDGTRISLLNDTDETLGVTGGYNFSESFGIEFGYRNLGEYNNTVDGERGLLGLAIDASGWVFGIVGNLPASNRIDLYGKLGILAWDLDVSAMPLPVERHRSSPVSADVSDSGADLYFGAGGKVGLGKRQTVDLGLEYINYDGAASVNLVLTFNIRGQAQP